MTSKAAQFYKGYALGQRSSVVVAYCSLWYRRALTSGVLWRLMPKKRKLSVKLPVVVATVIRPVATRLNRIEDLLIEMRGVLDVHLKRIATLQKQVDILIEKDRVSLPD
jgi:hypothetical protein